MRIVCPGTRAVNKQSCELSYEMAVVGVWRLFLDEEGCGSELSACRNCADRTLFVLHTPSSTEPGVCGLSDWSLRILNNGLHEYATAKWGNSLQRGRTSKPIKLRLVEGPKRILKSILVSYALLSFCSSSVRAGMISKMSPTTP